MALKGILQLGKKQCSVCGGKMVYIRGRIPHTPKRLICPTCAYEKLESVQNYFHSVLFGEGLKENKV